MSEPQVDHLISVSQAKRILDSLRVTQRVETVSLADCAGRILAEEIRADRDYPAVAKSRMDGFAVRCADVKTLPVELEVVGEIAAGKTFDRSLEPGETVAIMTGAGLPGGADGVVPVEDTRKTAGKVQILRGSEFHRFVAPIASDRAAGASLLQIGRRIGPADIAVLASVGRVSIKVAARPRVRVISTGDEIVPIDAKVKPTQLRNSNGPMLASLIRQLGCDVSESAIVRDDPAAIRSELQAAGEYDIVFITGGMSMGEYDFVPRVLAELNVDLQITKLKIKPGKPFVFGVSPGPAQRPIYFGLPGNPVSAYVCTSVLASRVIRRMLGTSPEPLTLRVQSAVDMEPNGARAFFMPAKLEAGLVNPLKWVGSADVFTLAQANCLVVREENSPALRAGEWVDVIML